MNCHPSAIGNGYDWGNSGRNVIFGPSVRNIDMSLMRSFKTKGSDNNSVQFRAEFYNATNTPQFSNPNTTVTSSTFTSNSATANDARGGAIYLSSGAATVTASTFDSNSAAGQANATFGGAIATDTGATLTVAASTALIFTDPFCTATPRPGACHRPLLVEEDSSTTLVCPGQHLRVDERGFLRIR